MRYLWLFIGFLQGVVSWRSWRPVILQQRHLLTEPATSSNLISSKRQTYAQTTGPIYMSSLDIEDEDERELFDRVANRYLAAKFQYCMGQSSLEGRNELGVRDLLRDVLPPLSNDALEKEVENLYSRLSQATAAVTTDNFVQAVRTNPYWLDAGAVVVKELIYLDCLYHFYHRQQSFLGDEDYNDLKNSLSWEGSAAAALSGKEALFVSAVASHHKGHNVLSDSEYMSLKKELQAEKSWVVMRALDPLEKMGMKTFMSYLHKSL